MERDGQRGGKPPAGADAEADAERPPDVQEDAKRLVAQIIRGDEQPDDELVAPVRALAAKLRAMVVLTARLERLVLADPLVTTVCLAVSSRWSERPLRGPTQGGVELPIGAFVAEYIGDGLPRVHLYAADQQGEVTHNRLVCAIRHPGEEDGPIPAH